MRNFIGNGAPGWNTNSVKCKFTSEGGYAILVTNGTGAPSIKGTVVHVSTTPGAVDKIPIDNPDPVGVMYDDGIPHGESVWVVIAGMAQVLYSTAVTSGTFARCPQTADPTATAGQAISESLPAPPFATDKHFLEIGHPIETIVSPGLALTILHFN